jgi:hypothetical protein
MSFNPAVSEDSRYHTLTTDAGQNFRSQPSSQGERGIFSPQFRQQTQGYQPPPLRLTPTSTQAEAQAGNQAATTEKTKTVCRTFTKQLSSNK